LIDQVLTVCADGRLMLGDVELYGGCWYRCLMPGGWCDVLIECGPTPDVQREGWHVALPYDYRGMGVDGLLVRGWVQE